jgi:hypothetical protein
MGADGHRRRCFAATRDVDIDRGGCCVATNAERLAQLAARRDPELAVGVAQVVLDGSDGDDERCRDLAVLMAGGRHFGDAALAGSQRSRTADQRTPRSRASRAQLGERLALESGLAATVSEIDREPQTLSRLQKAAVTPQRSAERDMRSGARDRIGACQSCSRPWNRRMRYAAKDSRSSPASRSCHQTGTVATIEPAR